MANVYFRDGSYYVTFNSPYELIQEFLLPNKDTFKFLKSPLVITLITITIIVISTIYHLYTRSWGAKKYIVPIPAECDSAWEGQIWEDQRIKVCLFPRLKLHEWIQLFSHGCLMLIMLYARVCVFGVLYRSQVLKIFIASVQPMADFWDESSAQQLEMSILLYKNHLLRNKLGLKQLSVRERGC